MNVASAAEWLSQEVAWGGTAATLSAGAAALSGVPIAIAAAALKAALDPTGRYDDSAYYPEPVREWKGTEQSYWNAFLKHADEYHLMMSNSSESGGNSSSNLQGETSPANPDPENNKPRYEKSSKHGREQRGNVSPAPTNGQSTLDRSVQVKPTSPRRVGVDPATGEYVVFDQTTPGVFHGHTRSWGNLTTQMQKALVDSGQVNKRGKINE